MPQRKTTVRLDSTAAQGEGSWVEIRRLTVGDIHSLRKVEGDAYELGENLLRSRLVAWNWVDDKGQPLAQPGEPGFDVAFDSVTDEELKFLAGAIAGDAEARKN